MKVLALALFSVATALPFFKRQDSDVAVDMSDIQKFKEAQNSLPDSGTYRLDIVPGRKDGESSKILFLFLTSVNLTTEQVLNWSLMRMVVL